MENKEADFMEALAGKKIPILTLDHKWISLFSQHEKTGEIQALEEQLNDLLKQQGKANTDLKEVKKLKKQLMDEIVQLADALVKDPDSKKLDKDMQEHKRLVEDCNEKIDACEDMLMDLPRQIDYVNRQLMLASMNVCYRQIRENDREIAQVAQWAAQVRRELKKKMVRKQEKEAANNELYGYMHDIFGADVIELFDLQYRVNRDGRPKDHDEEPTEQVIDKEAAAVQAENSSQIAGAV